MPQLQQQPSGLPKAIDGVAAQEDTLLFMTIIHTEQLSRAVFRPGSMDGWFYQGPAHLQQTRDLFVFFCQDLPFLLLQLPLATAIKSA